MPSLHLSPKNIFCFFAKTAEKSLTIFKKFDIIFRQSNERAVAITYMRTWRNWQTHKTKDLMRLFSCRFKSCCPHHVNKKRTFYSERFVFCLPFISGCSILFYTKPHCAVPIPSKGCIQPVYGVIRPLIT